MDTPRYGFESWPLDLLIDYALKTHHRKIRANGPGIQELIDSTVSEYPVMAEVGLLFAESLEDLESHLMKEEQVLFPFLYELCDAALNGERMGAMHCGSVIHPISVMKMEHASEIERYDRVRALTNNFTAPEGASEALVEAMDRLKDFVEALLEHIHIENDLIFPMAEQLENSVVE